MTEINDINSSSPIRKKGEQFGEINISTAKVDIVVAGLRAVAGAIPWAGPLVAEVITSIIPNQRIDRLEKYLLILRNKLEALEKDQVEKHFQDPAFIDLFEDGLHQAIRALSPERLDHIASLLKNSLSEEDVQFVRYKHVLQLLGDLNDVQIVLLKAYTVYGDEGAQYREKHKDAISIPPPVMGSTQEVVDQSTVHRNYKDHMVRLGLLRPNFKKPRKGEFPEFDEKTGMIKASGYEITPLGRLLLRYIDPAKKSTNDSAS